MKKGIVLFVIVCTCINVLIQSCTAPKGITTTAKNKIPKTKYIRSANALLLDGNKKRLDKDFEGARKDFLNAIEQNPKLDAAYFYLAKMSMDRLNNAEAATYAKQALELQPTNKYYKELYANSLAYTGINVAKAIELYNELAQQDIRFAEKNWTMAAYYQLKSNKLSDALATYNLLEKNFGIQDDIVFKKIKILKQLNKQNEVIAEIDKLIKEDPTELNYHLLKIEMLQDANQKAKADAYTKTIEEKFATDPRLMPAMALKALEQGDTASYIKKLETCISNTNIAPEEKVALLTPYINIANNDSIAKQKLNYYGKEIYKVSPNDSRAIRLYSNILYTSEKYEEAMPLLYKIIAQNKTKLEPWEQLLYCYLNTKKYESVVAVSKQALTYFPNQAGVYFLNAIGNQNLKDNTKAIKSYNKALDYAVGNEALQAQIYSSLADMYYESKNYKTSDSCFDQALQINKDDATILNNYAYYLSVRNVNLEKAATMSKRSIALRKEKSYLDTYAWILYRMGKFEEAIKYQTEAIAMPGTNDATLYEHLGDMYFKANIKDKALEQWKKAITLPGGSEFLQKKITNNQLYEQ